MTTAGTSQPVTIPAAVYNTLRTYYRSHVLAHVPDAILDEAAPDLHADADGDVEADPKVLRGYIDLIRAHRGAYPPSNPLGLASRSVDVPAGLTTLIYGSQS